MLYNVPLELRLWTNVNVGEPGECWEWQGSIGKRGGYGQIRYQGKTLKPHRLAYEFEIGLIPEGMMILHSCDNPKCCNPRHLRPGTHADNTADKMARGRHVAAGLKGEQHRMVKLTEQQVREIQRRYAMGGCTHRSLGAEYGVSKTAIGCIVRGVNWRHLPKRIIRSGP